jgi:hypothetical protein
MFSLNKLSDDDTPIPITHRCRPDRIGKDMTGLELHEFGLALFTSYFSNQGWELFAINMNPENGAPHVMIWNQQKVLLYIWVKTDLAPNIPVYVPNCSPTYEVDLELCFNSTTCIHSGFVPFHS